MAPRRRLAIVAAATALLTSAVIAATPAGANPVNTRLTNDAAALGGYTSDYTLVTGTPYTDPVLTACSQSRGRQNEPAVAVDPRDPKVIVGSSNDYCGVFNSDGTFVEGLGPVWLGYYRSENSGASFVSSLVGLPGGHVAVRRERRGAHCQRRRPGARLGLARPPLRRVGELR